MSKNYEKMFTEIIEEFLEDQSANEQIFEVATCLLAFLAALTVAADAPIEKVVDLLRRAYYMHPLARKRQTS